MLTVAIGIQFEERTEPETQTTTLRRLAELNVKPQHDLDGQKEGRAKLWGWCECGCVHELTHDCPRCYDQQPETD